MTIPRIQAVGFCAHYSEVGDWAFQYALRLAEENQLQLNVFHFLSDPYNPSDDTELRYSRRELTEIALSKERELRMYYDAMAGDFLDIGFRLCYDDSWRELHRCLAGHEFQVLVLAKPGDEVSFANKPIDEFADNFVCPVILVGPESAETYRVNSRAALWIDKLSIPSGRWEQIEAG